MARVSRDTVLIDMALVASQRGTCDRLQVGVVFSKEGRIIMTGYNGAPAGMPHCDHSNDILGFKMVEAQTLNPDKQHRNPGLVFDVPLPEIGCTIAQHAERNAIAYAARHGVALGGSEAHVTHMPCYDCAGSLINAGIERVVYLEPYRKTNGVELLRSAGVEVVDYRAEVR
jgi:dCMP deaminase